MYTKRFCKKSHAECPLIHNPTCWHFTHNNGKCLKGDNCLFPHRDPHKSGQFVSRSDDAQAPAGRGGQPQATTQGGAADKKGKNKKNDPAPQGNLHRLGESVISSSSGVDAIAPTLSAGHASSAHLGASRSNPVTGRNESRSMPQQAAMQQPATRE